MKEARCGELHLWNQDRLRRDQSPMPLSEAEKAAAAESRQSEVRRVHTNPLNESSYERTHDEKDDAAGTIQRYWRGFWQRKVMQSDLARKAKMQEFTLAEFASIIMSCAVPIFDAGTDVLVMNNWWVNDHSQWLTAALIIHFVAGTAAGSMLYHWDQRPLDQINVYRDLPLGIFLGWLGFAPAAQAWITVKDARSTKVDDKVAREDLMHLKIMKAIELLLEALPQLTLQTYVGVAYGQLDPGNDDFSITLATSVCLSMVRPGLALFSLEILARNQQRRQVTRPDLGIVEEDFPKLGLDQWQYGLATSLWRSAQVVAICMWFAMCACAFKFDALLAMPFIVTTFGLSVYESAFWRSTMAPTGLPPARKLPAWALTVSIGMSQLVVVAGLIVAFNTFDHADNNYANESLPETGNTTAPQYFRCEDRDIGTVTAWAGTILSVVLMLVAVLLDPQHGGTPAALELKQEKKVSDEEILLGWLDSKPARGHKGAITFQLNNTRRKALHRLADTNPRGETLYHISARQGGYRRLCVTLPPKRDSKGVLMGDETRIDGDDTDADAARDGAVEAGEAMSMFD